MGTSFGGAYLSGGAAGGYSGFDANYRGVGVQTQVLGKTPLQINGSATGFNNLGFEVWDAANSRIRPSNTTQKFSCRLTLDAIASVAGSTLAIALDISDNADNSALVYTDEVPIFKVNAAVRIMRFFPFFVSDRFIRNGGLLTVSCDNMLTIENASLYLKLTGGVAP